MTAVDPAETLPLNLHFSNLQKKSRSAEASDEVPSMSPTLKSPSLSSTLKSRSIFDAVKPDAVFIQDMTQGLADTSWERQETSAWVSDEEDSYSIEAQLQTARHLSSKNLLPVTGNDLLGNIPSPAGTNVSKSLLTITGNGSLGNTSSPASKNVSKNVLPVIGNDSLENIPSPASTHVSKNLSSTPASDNGRVLTPVQPMTSDVDCPVIKSLSGELYALLKSAELESWIDKFVEQDIDLDCIADLTDNDLIGIGMSKIGTRRKFQRIVRQWVQQKSDQCS